mgnify:CR=1 FL=1
MSEPLSTAQTCDAQNLAARLRCGEAALFPTDTLPALAAQPASAALLWELKQRPQHKPVILMAATAEELWTCLGQPIKPEWRKLAEQHWPGGLTLVLPAKGAVLQQLNPGGSSLGLRVPNCSAALELLQASGPLATTSANRSGEPPCLTAEAAMAAFPGIGILQPTPWPPPSGQASTVLAWRQEGGWQLLRQGAVMPELVLQANA